MSVFSMIRLSGWIVLPRSKRDLRRRLVVGMVEGRPKLESMVVVVYAFCKVLLVRCGLFDCLFFDDDEIC